MLLREALRREGVAATLEARTRLEERRALVAGIGGEGWLSWHADENRRLPKKEVDQIEGWARRVAKGANGDLAWEAEYLLENWLPTQRE